MANIQTYLSNIKNALFGRDVRSSIHDGIDAINKEVENTTGRQVDLENTFDQLVINAGNSNAEIVDARVKNDGTSYSKLGDRLDAVDSQLAQNTTDIEEIESTCVKTVNGMYPDNYGNVLVTQTVKPPTFANTINDCTDTSKVYMLPDGYLYVYKETEVGDKYIANFTNLFDKNNCKLNTRLSSSSESASDGYILTNWIKLPASIDVNTLKIRYKNASLADNKSRFQWGNREMGDATTSIMYSNAAGLINGTDENGDSYISLVVDGSSQPAKHIADGVVKYFRCAFYFGTTPVTQEDANSIIITIDEPITYTYQEPEISRQWVNTGLMYNQPADYEHRINSLESVDIDLARQINSLESEMNELDVKLEDVINNSENNPEIPDYWQEHINSKIETIKALQRTGGRECFSFALITDSHYPSNLGKLSPILARHIMDECNIKFLLNCGDNQTRSCHSTKEELLEENKRINEMFAPVKDRMLLVEGNHDGSYATIDGITYVKQLTESEIFEEYYRQIGLVGDIHFSDNCNAYYVDDTIHKVRYIGLNSLNVPNDSTDINEDGTAKYVRFRNTRFRQEQIDFVANEALVNGINDAWNIILFTHIAPHISSSPSDSSAMTYVLWAYQNRLKHTYEYVGSEPWDTVSLNVDFTNAQGRIIGIFAGHNHVDDISTAALNVNCILTRCDARQENTTELHNERVLGTITEQSFDIFTVNKSERKVYVTKIGAGDDREFTY